MNGENIILIENVIKFRKQDRTRKSSRKSYFKQNVWKKFIEKFRNINKEDLQILSLRISKNAKVFSSRKKKRATINLILS